MGEWGAGGLTSSVGCVAWVNEMLVGKAVKTGVVCACPTEAGLVGERQIERVQLERRWADVQSAGLALKVDL